MHQTYLAKVEDKNAQKSPGYFEIHAGAIIFWSMAF